MHETPTLFDRIGTEGAVGGGTTMQFWVELLYNQEVTYNDKLSYDEFCGPIKGETISLPEKDISAPTVDDIPDFSRILTIKVNLSKFICTDSCGDTAFDMERFIAQARATAHIADDLLDLKMAGMAQAVSQLRKSSVKHQRESVFIENLREQLAATRQLAFKFLYEKQLLSSIALSHPYDTAFISEIKRIFILKITEESVNMAKSRGAFPAYTSAADANEQFARRIQLNSQPLFEEMIMFGRRNTFVF